MHCCGVLRAKQFLHSANQKKTAQRGTSASKYAYKHTIMASSLFPPTFDSVLQGHHVVVARDTFGEAQLQQYEGIENAG